MVDIEKKRSVLQKKAQEFNKEIRDKAYRTTAIIVNFVKRLIFGKCFLRVRKGMSCQAKYLHSTVLTICFCMIVPSADAALGGIIAGAVGDHLIGKAGHEARLTVDATEKALRRSIKLGDEAAKDRLEQLEGMVNESLVQIADLEKVTIRHVEEILVQVNNDVLSLQEIVFANLRKLISEVECVGKRFTHLESRVLGGRLKDILGVGEVEHSLPPLYRGEPLKYCTSLSERMRKTNCRAKKPPDREATFIWTQPYSTSYEKIKKHYLDRLEHATEETPISTIIQTYEGLIDLSLYSQCLTSTPTGLSRMQLDNTNYTALLDTFRSVFGRNVGGLN